MNRFILLIICFVSVMCHNSYTASASPDSSRATRNPPGTARHFIADRALSPRSKDFRTIMNNPRVRAAALSHIASINEESAAWKVRKAAWNLHRQDSKAHSDWLRLYTARQEAYWEFIQARDTAKEGIIR